jgi:hypothetical protein
MKIKFLKAALHVAVITMSAFSMTACGGGSTAPSPTVTAPVAPGEPIPPVIAAPAGLYVGYYQEDPLTNPEDPTSGAFVLNLPDKDSAFNGAMYFTYVGCQTSNVGSVVGTKTGNALSGTWSGTVDGSAQSGLYNGTYDSGIGNYQGVYSNSGGKQFKSISNCIQYYIGPNGTWAMFPIEQNLPKTFAVVVNSALVSWVMPVGGASSLLYVIDPVIAQSGSGNPTKYQTILPANTSTFNLGLLGLTSGKEYIVAALINSNSSIRLAFGSKKFIAP